MMSLLFLVFGLALLVAGADWLVKGSSRLAAAVGISPLVVGLTVVAFGTSAPELTVSVSAAWGGQPDIALGNVVGSNICNILLILGLAALITPLTVAQRLIQLDVPLLIAVSVLMYLLALDGIIGRFDGVVLAAGIVAYTVFAIIKGRREQQAVAAEYAAEFGADITQRGRHSVLLNFGLVVVGLALLIVGGRWLVDGAVAGARWLGVSELIIGLTVVAIGTSLPEVATSVIASLRGERDIAVGNVIGSNLFNIMAVLGLTSLVAPNGIGVSEAALRFDMLVMIAAALACLPIFFTGHRIARWEGGLFLGYYIVYLTILVLQALQSPLLASFSLALWGFVLPLTVLTLAVSLWQSKRSRIVNGS